MEETLYLGPAKGLYMHDVFRFFITQIMKYEEINPHEECSTSHNHKWNSKDGGIVKYSIDYPASKIPQGIVKCRGEYILDYKTDKTPKVTLKIKGEPSEIRQIRVFSHLQSLVIEQILASDKARLEDRIISALHKTPS